MIELIKDLWEFDPACTIGLMGIILVLLAIGGKHIQEYLHKRKRG